jgi:hypothetical protein
MLTRGMRGAAAVLALAAFLPVAARAQAEPPAEAPPPAQPLQPYPTYPPPIYYPAPAPLYYAAPPPRKMHEEKRPRWGMFAAGTVIFGALWLSCAAFAYALDDGYAAIPLIGPLFYLDASGTSDARSNNVGLVFMTIGQASGIALGLMGLLWKRRVLVPDVAFAPLTLPGGGGLAALARF